MSLVFLAGQAHLMNLVFQSLSQVQSLTNTRKYHPPGESFSAIFRHSNVIFTIVTTLHLSQTQY